jgi:hypothetical protein
MMSRTELQIEYSDQMKPISATCAGCGEKMPMPPVDLENTVDVIVWFSNKYLDHRKLKHSNDERRRLPRD